MINYEKSTFVLFLPFQLILSQGLAIVFGCPVSTFPQTYVGLPLTVNKIRGKDLQPLLCAVEGYIPKWCGKTLPQVVEPCW